LRPQRGRRARAQGLMQYGNRIMKDSRGFTLVELLVVVAIISTLIALLLPAVQAAREAGRRLECINHLKQIALAVTNHENALKHFPTGGWGWRWVGDPERGHAASQPGGWAYNILPYMEQANLHNMGMNQVGAAKLDDAAKMIAVPLSEFICPTRRPAETYPYHPGYSPQTYNASPAKKAARTDYAVNRGDFYVDGGEGPKYYDDDKYNWPDTSQITGISFIRSAIQVRDITDGLSNTYLIGEKYVNSQEYTSGGDLGDDSSLCQGDDFDIARYSGFVYYKGNKLVSESVPPLKDMRTYTDYFCFGSAHPNTWQMSFCDSSVHSISYDIDPDLHARLGNRCDGEAVDKSQITSD
jgi:prepilin-type N-terminal cleavage/methylation domain-containing protein